MKIVAHYASRIIAEEDRDYLISQGIAAAVYGDDAPQCMVDHFGCDPIAVAVMDEFYPKARVLLDEKKHSDILTKVPKWLKASAKKTESKKRKLE